MVHNPKPLVFGTFSLQCNNLADPGRTSTQEATPMDPQKKDPMMVNAVNTNDTLELHRELALASAKQDRRDARAMRNAGYGATTAGLVITSRYLDKLTKAVTTKLTTLAERSDTYHFNLERQIRQLRPEVIALVCLQGGLQAVATDMVMRDTMLNMGRMLAIECFAAGLTRHDRKRAKEIAEKVSKSHGSVKYRIAAARKLAKQPQKIGKGKNAKLRAGFEQKYWSRTLTLHAGEWCVNRLIETLPDLFCLVEVWGSKGMHTVLSTTEEGITMANDAVSEAVLRAPVYQPRTDITPWTSYYKGIAEDPRVTYDVSLIRARHKDVIGASQHALRTGVMKPALDAVNALQGVGYTINTWVLDLIAECDRLAIPAPGLPMKDPLPIVRLPAREFAALDEDARDALSKEISGKKKVNRARHGDRVSYEQDMETARIMATHERFHVPMNFDKRGRVYGISHFNFQREDRVRSLFLFADGEPIGEEGLQALKVHVANCGDFGKVSKKPIEERIAWVDEHLEEIAKMVQWPTGRAFQWWREADTPFQFLAACRELISALNAGPTYVAQVPVAFDGSCNGIQHLCAMTRAPEGLYVNLTSDPTVFDVYGIVADDVKLVVEADLKDPEYRKVAKTCLEYGVNRSLLKRNVMTYGYSSKAFGMSQQIVEDTMEPLRIEVFKRLRTRHPFGTEREQFAAAKYLAKRTYACIEQRVPYVAEAMRFMQGLARALAHEGKPLRWTTPVGIPFVNRYHEHTTEKVKLWLNDHGVTVRQDILLASGHKQEIDKDRAANAVAANVTHACDASHLLLTVNACVAEGITQIATVHDSFGCLPSRAVRFNQIIREQFLRMYTDHDVLAELLASARADLDNHDKLPELPAKGTLDLTEVLNAQYAFA